MNFKRICMGLISLVLVACLLVNVSPIKAAATSAAIAAIPVAVPGVAVIGACLVGLGVLVGVATTDWDDVVDNAVEYYKEQGVIGADGNMDIYSLTNAGYQYGVAEDMLSGLKDWLFENEVITETSVSVPSGFAIYNGIPLPLINSTTSYPYECIVSISGVYSLIRSSVPFVQRDFSGFGMCGESDGQYWAYSYVESSSSWGSGTYSNCGPTGVTIIDDFIWANYDVFCFNSETLYLSASEPITESSTTISLNGDLIMGEIASAADSIAAGYSQWANNAVDALTNDADLTAVYPIAYSAGQTLDAVRALTQDEVWTGVISGTTLPDEDVTPTPDIGDISVALGDVTTSVFLNSLADLIETLPLIPPNIEDAIEQLPIYVSDIRDFIETLPQWQDSLLNHIEQLPGYIRDIRDFIEQLPIWQNNLLDHIETFPDTFSIWLDPIKVKGEEIAETLTKTWETIKTLDMSDYLTRIYEGIETKALDITKALSDSATRVAEEVKTLTKSLVVPDKDYLSDKVNALLAEYAFAESIVNTAKSVKTGLAGITTEPPVIYIHLENTRGPHNIGGTVPFLDLRWYAEYKPTVDTIISAFLWICFAWKMLLKLPGIISGMPGDFVMDSVHHIGMSEHMPVRKAEYEVQRVSSRQYIRRGKDG